jgi:hypothetical protein
MSRKLSAAVGLTLAFLVVLAAAPADAAGLFRARHAAAAGCDTCCDPCEPTITVKLDVCHPCCCEKQCVEVCLPACCTGEPCVYDRCTLVGCGATVYEWDCGVRVVVRYWRNGDITVKYR